MTFPEAVHTITTRNRPTNTNALRFVFTIFALRQTGRCADTTALRLKIAILKPMQRQEHKVCKIHFAVTIQIARNNGLANRRAKI
jgi:hypothetical protein